MRNPSAASPLVALALALPLGACAADSGPDDLSDLAGLDAKSDTFSKKLKVVGSLSYGESTGEIAYRNPPRYRAVTFHGTSGDTVDAWVHTVDGYAIGWLTDATFQVIAHSEAVGPNGDEAHLHVAPLYKTGLYYIVFRDGDAPANGHFRVELDGGGWRAPGDFYSCRVDDDCVATPKVGCCDTGEEEAIYRTEVPAYQRSFTCSAQHPICPLVHSPDARLPECDQHTHRCEMVDVAHISCGGPDPDPHACPVGYACHTASTSLPGSCVRHCLGNVACLAYQHWDGTACACVDNPSCGGITGGGCDAPYARCVDDPRDDCDPAQGGADCPALCSS